MGKCIHWENDCFYLHSYKRCALFSYIRINDARCFPSSIWYVRSFAQSWREIITHLWQGGSDFGFGWQKISIGEKLSHGNWFLLKSIGIRTGQFHYPIYWASVATGEHHWLSFQHGASSITISPQPPSHDIFRVLQFTSCRQTVSHDERLSLNLCNCAFSLMLHAGCSLIFLHSFIHSPFLQMLIKSALEDPWISSYRFPRRFSPPYPPSSPPPFPSFFWWWVNLCSPFLGGSPIC